MKNLPEKIYTRKDVILERINVDDVEFIRKDVAEQMAKEFAGYHYTRMLFTENNGIGIDAMFTEFINSRKAKTM